MDDNTPVASAAAALSYDRRLASVDVAPLVHKFASARTSLLWPDTFLIGLSKAGTSTIHSCLTSDVFGDACCKGAKELRLWRYPEKREPDAVQVLEMHSRLQREWRSRRDPTMRRPPWPTLTQPGPYTHLLDFTPGYLQDLRVADAIHSLYGPARAAGLHFVVVLRDPASRTRSHFCMAGKNLKQLRSIFLTPATCHRYPTLCRGRKRMCDGWTAPKLESRGRRQPAWVWQSRCANDTGYRTSCVLWDKDRQKYSLSPRSPSARRMVRLNETRCSSSLEWMHRDVLSARARIRRAFPAAVIGGAVSVPILAGQVMHGSEAEPPEGRFEQLRRALWPWVAASCPPASNTYGWEQRNLSLLESATRQVQKLWVHGSHGSRCQATPAEASTMSLAELRQYTTRCRRLADGFLHYADATVPLFHLAYYLKRFPISRWTFVRYEAVFDERHGRDATTRWLARLFNLTLRPAHLAAAGCNFSRVRGESPAENEYVGRRVPSSDSAVEDGQLRALFAPWQSAMEALISSSGHHISERGGREV